MIILLWQEGCSRAAMNVRLAHLLKNRVSLSWWHGEVRSLLNPWKSNPFGDSSKNGTPPTLTNQGVSTLLVATPKMLPFIRRLVPILSCLEELSLSYVRVLGNVPLQDGELMPPMCRPPWGFPPSMSPPLSYAIYLRISWALTSQIIWISLYLWSQTIRYISTPW
jgi:hypothetical protein